MNQTRIDREHDWNQWLDDIWEEIALNVIQGNSQFPNNAEEDIKERQRGPNKQRTIDRLECDRDWDRIFGLIPDEPWEYYDLSFPMHEAEVILLNQRRDLKEITLQPNEL